MTSWWRSLLRKTTQTEAVTASPVSVEPPHSVRYFHGGTPGLAVGGKVLCRAVLPAWQHSQVFYGETSAEAIGDDGTHVYMTSDVGVARAHAGEYRTPSGSRVPGALYEVQPIGTVFPDPDYPLWPERFLRARAARIISVVETDLYWPNPRYFARAVAEYRITESGIAFLGTDGYIHRNLTSREQAQLLGRWIPHHYVTEDFRLKADLKLPPPLKDAP